MSAANVDADLVREGGANLSGTDEALVEMTNGCICCTLEDDLLPRVRHLVQEQPFDHLVIEGTGIAEPLRVASMSEDGIGGFVYRARRPVHPAKFDAFLKRTWPSLIGAKRLFWLATCTAHVGEISLAGATCRMDAMGYWWAAISQDRWPDHSDGIKRAPVCWVPGWGDRRQELVYIGQRLDEAGIWAAIDECLEGPRDPFDFESHAFKHVPDPFPRWERSRAA